MSACDAGSSSRNFPVQSEPGMIFEFSLAMTGAGAGLRKRSAGSGMAAEGFGRFGNLERQTSMSSQNGVRVEKGRTASGRTASSPRSGHMENYRRGADLAGRIHTPISGHVARSTAMAARTLSLRDNTDRLLLGVSDLGFTWTHPATAAQTRRSGAGALFDSVGRPYFWANAAARR